MQIAFFGTSDRSLPILEALKSKFELVVCITKADVPVGRHQVPQASQVKTWAIQNGVHVVTISTTPKQEAPAISEQLKSSGAVLGVVADFGFMLPPELLALFSHGLINVHFSLLPKYRGASPVQFAMLAGDTQTGISYQLMEAALDAGPIISQTSYPLTNTETAGQLYQTLFSLAGAQLPQVITDYITGKTVPQPQDEARASYTYSPSHPTATVIFKEDARLNWKSSVQQISAAIRAYNPWPIAWTTLGELQASGHKVTGFTTVKDATKLTKVVKLYTASCTATQLSIKTLKLADGNMLTWEQFTNGYLV
jgi:methionyl-tRNA formyltransferase